MNAVLRSFMPHSSTESANGIIGAGAVDAATEETEYNVGLFSSCAASN